MTRVRPRETYGPPKTGKLTRAQSEVIRKWREAFRREIGKCEHCGHNPRNPWRDKPIQCSVLTVHEIARGNGVRMKCLDKRFGILCLCYWCNSVAFDDAAVWPIPRQLALLKVRRPEDYDLRAFVSLIRPHAPQWVTEAEVRRFERELEDPKEPWMD